MEAWEYFVLREIPEEARLDELGRQGWELVSATWVMPGFFMIFKRRLIK